MDKSAQTIRLERRSTHGSPKAVDLKCQSIEWVEATWHDIICAKGPASRSILEGPRVIAIGLPDFDEDAGWNWIIQPGHGEHEIVSMQRSGGEVRFVLRPSPGETAIMGRTSGRLRKAAHPHWQSSAMPA